MLWAASDPRRLSAAARRTLQDESNRLHFSVASLWEIAIKASLGRPDFSVDAGLLRRGLLDNQYRELPIEAAHVFALGNLSDDASVSAPHKDPFDRMLVAQAQSEGLLLLTSDRTLLRYGGPVRLV